MNTTATAKDAPQSDMQLPVLQGYAKEFYAWCKKHDLRFQRCAKCKTWRHPPRPLCNNCHSFDTEWGSVKGTGKVYAWTVAMAPIGRAWNSSMPYAAVIVELDEGMRMATWVTGIKPDELKRDMRVSVWYDDLTPAVTLAKFKPV